MNKNIKTTFKDGKVEYYMTQSSDDLRMPSLGFITEEEAELAVAIAKTLKVYGKKHFNLGREIIYVLRVLGIQNGWTE